nr:hypothetical protein BaRGS_006218 [Batillaria attramentaria]
MSVHYRHYPQEETMKPVDRRTRGATVKGFLVGFLSGVALTVIIGVSVYFTEDANHEVIVDTLPTPPEPEYLVACNCPTEEDADFLATVSLVYPSWSDILTNHDSLAFKQLVLHTEEVINNVFRATDISSYFDHCRVTAFRKTGTDRVQAEMRLFFSKDFSATASELVDAFHFGYTTLLQIPSSGDVGTIDSASFTPTSLGHTPLTSSTQPAHTSPGLPKPLPIADGTCGIGRQYPKASSGRIVGGTATEWYGVYPWVVLILRHGRHLCGGTVWDAQHILTAAHCFSGLPHLDDTILVNSSTLEIIAGKWKFSISDTWRYAQRVNVSAAMMHNYNDQTFENDIGILKLDRPLELNYVVEPICHPTNTTQLPQQGTVAGWGTLQGGSRIPYAQGQTINELVDQLGRDLVIEDLITEQLEDQDHCFCVACPNKAATTVCLDCNAVNVVETNIVQLLKLKETLEKRQQLLTAYVTRLARSDNVLMANTRVMLPRLKRVREDCRPPSQAALTTLSSSVNALTRYISRGFSWDPMTAAPTRVFTTGTVVNVSDASGLLDGVAVTTYENLIYFVDVSSRKSVVSHVRTSRRYQGIGPGVDDDTLVVSSPPNSRDPASVDVITRSGEVLKTVVDGKALSDLTSPNYLCVVGGQVLLSDYDAKTVFRVDLSTGRLVHRLSLPGELRPQQIVDDSDGYFYIACGDGYNLQKHST